MRGERFFGFLIIVISIFIMVFMIAIGIMAIDGPTYTGTSPSSNSTHQYIHITPVSPTVPVSHIWALIR